MLGFNPFFYPQLLLDERKPGRIPIDPKTMCVTVQIIFSKSTENRKKSVFSKRESRKTKHVPDELVKSISWKMTSLQSQGHVPV